MAQAIKRVKEERLKLFQEKLNEKRVDVQQKAIKEAKKRIEKNLQKVEERLRESKIQEKKQQITPPCPPKVVMRKERDISVLREKVSKQKEDVRKARANLAGFMGRSNPRNLHNADTFQQSRTNSKIALLDHQRHLEALKQQMAQKFNDLSLTVPPLCGCRNPMQPLDPMYTYHCANNCPLFKDEEQQHRLLKTFLVAHEKCR